MGARVGRRKLRASARKPEWSGRLLFARRSESATWIDQLEPASGDRFFFESAW